MTRSELYEARNAPSGNRDGPLRRCEQCGTPIEGPRSKQWCSEHCRKQQRRETVASSPPVVVHDELASGAITARDDVLVELVTLITL
jgi:hypothetical protein